MTVILVCGSGDWTDRATMTQYLVRLQREGTHLRLCGSGVVNEMALAVAVELGLLADVHEGWDRRMEPGSRAATILAEVRPAAVIAFTDRLLDRGALTGTGYMVVRANVAGIRATVVPSAMG